MFLFVCLFASPLYKGLYRLGKVDRQHHLLSKWDEGTPQGVWVPSAGLGAEVGHGGICVDLVAQGVEQGGKKGSEVDGEGQEPQGGGSLRKGSEGW